MNIIRIMRKEFKLNIRDFKANMMMILFPIVLIIILGTAFSTQFDRSIKLGYIRSCLRTETETTTT